MFAIDRPSNSPKLPSTITNKAQAEMNTTEATYLQQLYDNRFDPQQKQAKLILWRTLIDCFLQQHVGLDSDVLDIGGGYCEFINQIRARDKYLIDLNPDAQKFANADVKVLNFNILDSDATHSLQSKQSHASHDAGTNSAVRAEAKLPSRRRRRSEAKASAAQGKRKAKPFQSPKETMAHSRRHQDSDRLDAKCFDRIFISNFFEHLESKQDLIKILAFCWQHLKPGGSLLVIQPNFKYSYKEYYDFIDHHLPITHLALQELLETMGFKIEVMIPRFLPYSTKGRPASPLLLKLYLKLPLLWKILGGQMFIKAAKPIER